MLTVNLSGTLLRVKFLEMENNQLQEKTLTLANQIGILDRALRNLQSLCTVEVHVYLTIVFISI